MGFSRGELPTAGDRSPPAWSVRIGWGDDGWIQMSAWEGDCVGPVDRSPPVRIEWGDCWLQMWELAYWFCFDPVFDSLGSEKMTRWTKIPVSPYPRSRCLPVPAGSITASKSRIRDTSSCHSFERLFCSCHSEGPSKKLRQLGQQIHHISRFACSSDSSMRKSRPNSVGKDCDNPKTSASKSCEENSEYLRFRTMSWMSQLLWAKRIELREMSVMRMLSDLDSLLRNGGWSNLASANVRRPCAALVNCSFRVREQSVSAEASSVDVIRRKATSTGWDSEPNDLREHIAASCNVRQFRKRRQSVPSETISVGANSKKPTMTTWNSLPNDLQANVLQRVDFRDLFRLKRSSKSWKSSVESGAFRQSRSGLAEGEFTAINYYIKNKSWRCSGYDLHSRSWRSLPPVSYLPPPDAELFKEYSVCGHGGLMCTEVSKLPKKGELVVFNPLTGETRALPPLLQPRNPVLVHILVDSANISYKVIVAGSSAASEEHLSRKVEVFDSSTPKWKEVSDLRGPVFGLNEHQAGVCLNGKLFLTSFLESDCGSDCRRGVVAFDFQEEKWLQGLTIPIPWSSYSNTLQLVESDGKLLLFSEQETDRSVDHCIHELEFPDPEAGVLACQWRNVVRFVNSGGRGLLVYPEPTGILTCWGTNVLKAMKSGGRGLQHYIRLPLCTALVTTGARAEDQSTIRDFLSSNFKSPSTSLESLDIAKAVAVTVFAGLMMFGAAKFARGNFFRRRRAPGDQFDIDEGLRKETRPRSRKALRAIPPAI